MQEGEWPFMCCSRQVQRKARPALFQLEVKQFWQLPICLNGLNRASYFSSRTTGFLLYPGTGRMFLSCDAFTLIIWLGLRHSLVPSIWQCDCGSWMGGECCQIGCWMTNMGASGMLRWPVNINHSTSSWLLPTLQCMFSLTGPLNLVSF